MKTALFVLAICGCALSFPSSIDWDNIEANVAYIEPINDITYPTSRIIGGTEVVRNSVPFQVALIINGGSFCGGSVISPIWVLTAAHCTISASFVQLIFGAHNVQQTEATQLIVTSTNVVNHPQYNPSNLFSDVSVVRSPQQIVLNNNIQVIPLAPASGPTFAGVSARLTGWGRVSDSSTGISPILRGVQLTIIANNVCAQTYGNIIQPSTLCTSGAGTVGACQGDSGGPLVANGVQVGVTSFVAAAGCQNGLPSGFARVTSFRAWIASTTGV